MYVAPTRASAQLRGNAIVCGQDAAGEYCGVKPLRSGHLFFSETLFHREKASFMSVGVFTDVRLQKKNAVSITEGRQKWVE